MEVPCSLYESAADVKGCRDGTTNTERAHGADGALIAARRLFGAEGFTEVGAERIAREAGMTRGALYHQFDDKADLFAAVLDQVEAEIARRVADSVAGFDPDDSTGMLVAGAAAWLDASSEPDLQRIVLLDGPPSSGGIAGVRSASVTPSGSSPPSSRTASTAAPSGPARPGPDHVLVGAVDEAALYLAQAEDPAAARADIDLVLRRLTLALTAPG